MSYYTQYNGRAWEVSKVSLDSDGLVFFNTPEQAIQSRVKKVYLSINDAMGSISASMKDIKDIKALAQPSSARARAQPQAVPESLG